MESKKSSLKKTKLRNAQKSGSKIMLYNFLSIFLGCFGIIFLLMQLNSLQNEYTTMMDLNYKDILYMDKIESMIYKHESLIYQHMAMDDVKAKEKLRDEAAAVEEEIDEILQVFGANIKGGEYETYYHSIYSNVVGYFKNIAIIYDFSKDNDINTAEYYMDKFLNTEVEKVNKSIEVLRTMVNDDMDERRNSTSDIMLALRNSSMVILAALLIFGIMTQWICSALTHDIVSNDALTGLANTASITKFTNKLSAKKKINMYITAYLDLKHFKYINHIVGNEGGDETIALYGQKLNDFLIKGEKAGRLGNDNFIIILYKHRQQEFLDFISNIEVPVSDGRTIQNIKVNTRCGIYSMKENDTFAEALNNSSIAINYAKTKSLDDVIWYEQKIADALYSEKEVSFRFRSAIENNEFKVYYQPKVNMQTNTMIGCEALVRWERDGSVIQPKFFIQSLEKSGLIMELDCYVLEQVCRDIRKWIEKGLKCVPVSSNFSKINLSNPKFSENVLRIVNKYKVERSLFEFELTESTNHDDYVSLIRFLDDMGEAHIATAIDDFGIGYSSLELLKNPNVNIVKLDKKFIDNIELNNGSNDNQILVRNIIHTCYDMKKQVVCEGVENAEQRKLLLDMNCKVIQGYLYDKPLCEEEFEQRLINPVYEKGAI
ncbi:MAG: EAL domain-containing protein [Oscillospiraceae bacterium]